MPATSRIEDAGFAGFAGWRCWLALLARMLALLAGAAGWRCWLAMPARMLAGDAGWRCWRGCWLATLECERRRMQMKLENAKPFEDASKIAKCNLGSLGFVGCSFNKNLHLKTGLAQNSRWSCSPQTARSLRFAAVSGAPPGKLAGVPCSSLRQQEHGAMALSSPDR